MKGVALGEFSLDLDNAEYLPRFDAVLLLSVHHQWYAAGDEPAADALFGQALSIARTAVFVEFAALSEKFGPIKRFLDNDAASVQSFARDFLAQFTVSDKVKFLGSCTESDHEPYRFMFLIEK